MAIDPGSTHSGWVIFNTEADRVFKAGNDTNEDVLKIVRQSAANNLVDALVLEQPELVGQGNMQQEVIDTTRWCAKFEQCWIERTANQVVLLTRRDIKKHLLPVWNMPKADTIIKHLLRERWPAGKGTKKEPGPLFGISDHAWQALAAAVTYLEKMLWQKKS